MRVVVAGGGICGNALIRQLRHLDGLSIRAFERRSLEEASPPGLNVLMNHNGCAAVAHADPELWQKFEEIGHMVKNWSARDMAGRVLYDLGDVVASGEASWPAMVARWDLIHQATRCDELVEYGNAVESVRETPGGVSVLLTNGDEVEADLVVAADGRYSKLREQLAPAEAYYGPPYVADFRIVSTTAQPPLPEDRPLWRVYNTPLFDAQGKNSAISAAAKGLVRVGLMNLPGEQTGIFGNIVMPPNSGAVDDSIKSGKMLEKLFEAREVDEVGAFVLDTLREHGDSAHWARKQQTETCYTALSGKVLFLGDAAGAIYPSLGQGANLSLEDACVAAAAFKRSQRPERVAREVSILRTPRRKFIAAASVDHARHLVSANLLDEEATRWSDPKSPWRSETLKQLWVTGWPRAKEQMVIEATLATRESFAPFGQLVSESADGELYDPERNDADLDLSRGTPRLYLMKLDPGREFQVPRITRHSEVTQCLGGYEDFYLVVHAPDETPTLAGLKAFKIPTKQFVKLNAGTWHAGPFWEQTDKSQTFINLELKDTNEVDHFSLDVSDLPKSPTDTAKMTSLQAIPVLPVV